MVHVVLQLIVHPVILLHLMRPVGRIQFRTFVELIVPHQLITVRSIIGSLFCCSLCDRDGLAGNTRHYRDSTSAGLCHRISRNRDGDRTRLGCRVLGLDREEVIAHSHTPLLACCRDIDNIGATFGRSIDGLW